MEGGEHAGGEQTEPCRAGRVPAPAHTLGTGLGDQWPPPRAVLGPRSLGCALCPTKPVSSRPLWHCLAKKLVMLVIMSLDPKACHFYCTHISSNWFDDFSVVIEEKGWLKDRPVVGRQQRCPSTVRHGPSGEDACTHPGQGYPEEALLQSCSSQTVKLLFTGRDVSQTCCTTEWLQHHRHSQLTARQPRGSV